MPAVACDDNAVVVPNVKRGNVQRGDEDAVVFLLT